MKYTYMGIVVESSTPLDSALFEPCPEKMPTESKPDEEKKPRRKKEKE